MYNSQGCVCVSVCIWEGEGGNGQRMKTCTDGLKINRSILYKLSSLLYNAVSGTERQPRINSGLETKTPLYHDANGKELYIPGVTNNGMNF